MDGQEDKKKPRFVFAGTEFERKLCDIPLHVPSLSELYRNSFKDRGYMQETLQKAANSALENLLMWELIAHANGFSFQTLKGIGRMYTEMNDDYDTMTLVQSFGVRVVDDEEEKMNRAKEEPCC